MIKLKLAKEFKIKDLDSLRFFFGIEVARSKKGIYVSWQKYIMDLLNEVGMLGYKLETTPINPNHKLGANPLGTPVDKEQYQWLVGKLIYMSHTQPDIADVVGLVSKFMNAPMNCHMEAVSHILKYLKHTPGKGLVWETQPLLCWSLYWCWLGWLTHRQAFYILKYLKHTPGKGLIWETQPLLCWSL